jgi:hypothetical protein
MSIEKRLSNLAERRNPGIEAAPGDPPPAAPADQPTPDAPQTGGDVDLFNGELLLMESDDGKDSRYCLPDEEPTLISQGLRRMSVEDAAWWYRQKPTGPDAFVQWYGPFTDKGAAEDAIEQAFGSDYSLNVLPVQKAAADVQADYSNMLSDGEQQLDASMKELFGADDDFTADDAAIYF